MILKEEKDCWGLMLQHCFVEIIQIDTRLGLFLCDATSKAQLYIETSCRLINSVSSDLLNPAKPLTLAPALSLLQTKVTDVSILRTGQLRLNFVDARQLEVDPDSAYEAWQLGCSDGFMFVCPPGGKISLFK
jgi:hypothetical protein